MTHSNANKKPETWLNLYPGIVSPAQANQFSSDVSHELRTPLTSIRGALGLLSGGMLDPTSEQGQRLLKIAMNNTERLVHFTTVLEQDTSLNTEQKSMGDSSTKNYQNIDCSLLMRSIHRNVLRYQTKAKLSQQVQKLQINETRFRSIITNNADGILIINSQGIVQFANPAAEALFQVPAEQLTSKLLFGGLVAEVDHELHTCTIHRVGETAEAQVRVVQTQVEILNERDSKVFVEMRIVETEWEGKVAFLASLRDITQQKRTEQERDRFFTLSLDMLCICGFDGYFKRLNPAWVKTLGFTEEELLAKPYIELVHPEDRAATLDAVQKLFSGAQSISIENRNLCKDGSYKWFLWNVVPYSEDQLIYAIGRDITESKQAEAQLRQQTTQLKQTLRELKHTQTQLVQSEKMSALGQLVAGVAHEINNPVNFIHGNLNHAHQYAEDLLKLLHLYTQHYPNPVPEIQVVAAQIDLEFIVEDLQKILSSMKVGTDRIREIVWSLRNFSRLDEAQKKRVNIHEGIDSTLLILQHHLKANTQHPAIEIIKEYGNLPRVECYAGQLNQVFMNILSNAIDAIDEVSSRKQGENSIFSPQIRIRTEYLESGSIVIRIADNGFGMTEKVKQKLFNPFFTTKSVGKGTGLGLSISYQIIVEKHGGILKCTSELEQGTEFWIQIPIQQ